MQIVDFYSESNQNTIFGLSTSIIGGGQSFTGDGGILNSAKFYLKKTGLPTGNITVDVYAHTGTYGTNGTPTGSVLAQSDIYDISDLTTTFQLITFNFTGTNKISLTNDVNYFICISHTPVDNSNVLIFGIDNTSPTHSGNITYRTNGWYSNNTMDFCFYVYKDEPPVIVDSYSESNSNDLIAFYTGNYLENGQSFVGDGGTLNSCKFYVRKLGSPTGNAVAKIYAHTGTFGNYGEPTGTALATSDNFDVTSLTTDLTLNTLTFSGVNKIKLTNGTNYFVTFYYLGGDSSNWVAIGHDISGEHSGNEAYTADGSNWQGGPYDVCFYVYKDYTTTSPFPSFFRTP